MFSNKYIRLGKSQKKKVAVVYWFVFLMHLSKNQVAWFLKQLVFDLTPIR